jgi:phosphohistidine phosphatase
LGETSRTVKVFLIRHAQAVDEDIDLADSSRYLSGRGREVARAVGAQLREQGVVFETALTSPLVRAVQTAEIVCAGLGYDKPIVVLPSLAPGMSVRRVAEELPAFGTHVACFGHEPGISALAALLSSAPAFAAFRPGQVTAIDAGRAIWTLAPDTLALLEHA